MAEIDQHYPVLAESQSDLAAEAIDDELDRQADKLGSYDLARIQLGLMLPFPATTELPPTIKEKSGRSFRVPSGHVRFTEPGAADNNLTQGFGMTERLTPELIAINDAGLKLVRGAFAAARAKASAEIEPKPETEQPTLF